MTNLGFSENDYDDYDDYDDDDDARSHSHSRSRSRSAPRHTSNAFSHEANSKDETMKFLKLGVESLHYYIALSWLMIVLVPTAKKDEYSDYTNFFSWRGRGWCRLEFICAILAPNEPKIMMVNSSKGRLEFALPQDAYQLPPGKGNFSCCKRDHFVGGKEVECDKLKIRVVLDQILKSCRMQLELDERFFRLRFLVCLQHLFYRGLDDETSGLSSTSAMVNPSNYGQSNRRQSSVFGESVSRIVSKFNLNTNNNAKQSGQNESVEVSESHDIFDDVGEESTRSQPSGSFFSFSKEKIMEKALQNGQVTADELISGNFTISDLDRLIALKDELKWRDKAKEYNYTQETGTSVLFWAVLADDLSSVRELLRDKSVVKDDVNRLVKKDEPSLSIKKGTSLLHLAMSYSRMEIVMLLLKNGAKPDSVDKEGLDPFMSACVYGMHENIQFWLSTFPDWDLERKEHVAGYRALGLATMFGPGKLETIKLLLEAGANPHQCLNTGANLLTTMVINPDNDLSVAKFLLEYKDGLLRKQLNDGMGSASGRMTMKWKVLTNVANIFVRLGSKSPMMKTLAAWRGMTVLHAAANTDQVEIAKFLKETGEVDFQVKNSQGLTPLALAKITFGGEVPHHIGNILEDI